MVQEGKVVYDCSIEFVRIKHKLSMLANKVVILDKPVVVCPEKSIDLVDVVSAQLVH